MALIKFHTKNKVIYSKIESVPGVYESGITTSDCTAATEVSGSVTTETSSYEYLGDSNSRDEFTYETDSFADISITTPQQVLGVLNPALTVANAPLSKFFRACGANVAVDGGTGVVTISNSVAENSKLSFNFVKSSADDTVYQKQYKFYGMQGTVDIEASTKQLPQLKFAFKGNAFEPVKISAITPNYGNQTVNVASVVRVNTIVETLITPLGESFAARSTISGTPTITRVGNVATVTLTGHGLVDKQLVNISGATGAVDGYYYNGDFPINYVDANTFTYTMNGTPSGSAAGTLVAKKDGYAKAFCFSTLNAANFFGQELTRYTSGCEEGFERKSIPTDVSVTVLETHAPAFAITSITRSGTTATVTTAAPHGLVAGRNVTISGATDALYNIRTLVETAPTSTTFTVILGGTPAANAVAISNGSLQVVDNDATDFNPDANKTKFFAARLKFGVKNGWYVTYSWSKLQVADVKDGTVGNSEGRDITFRNTGSTAIILS